MPCSANVGTAEYSSIEVDTERPPGGLSLVFRTTGQWFVGPVEVTGKIRQLPNTGQLTGASRLDLGTRRNWRATYDCETSGRRWP
jgi:hypothetical protein